MSRDWQHRLVIPDSLEAEAGGAQMFKATLGNLVPDMALK